MQKIVLALAALAALGASAAVAASAGIQVGDRAPWPEAKETIALPDYSPDSLDGRVVLVEIFRTW